MSKKFIKLATIALGCGLVFFGCEFIRSDNLTQAAKSGDLERCRELVEAGTDVNRVGMHGMTPLMSACEAGSLELAVYLIEQNADINGHNDSGSVLMWAIHSRNAELVEYLLSQRVDGSWQNASN